jgi:hypothetical protein
MPIGKVDAYMKEHPGKTDGGIDIEFWVTAKDEIPWILYYILPGGWR